MGTKKHRSPNRKRHHTAPRKGWLKDTHDSVCSIQSPPFLCGAGDESSSFPNEAQRSFHRSDGRGGRHALDHGAHHSIPLRLTERVHPPSQGNEKTSIPGPQKQYLKSQNRRSCGWVARCEEHPCVFCASGFQFHLKTAQQLDG